MCSHTRACMRVHMAMGARVCICVCVEENAHMWVCAKNCKKGKRYKIYWCVLSEFPILFFFFFESSEFPIH